MSKLTTIFPLLGVIADWFRKIRLNLARRAVTRYAKREFNAAIKRADERYKNEHTMIYVCSKPFQPDVLTTYDRMRFKHRSMYGAGMPRCSRSSHSNTAVTITHLTRPVIRR